MKKNLMVLCVIFLGILSMYGQSAQQDNIRISNRKGNMENNKIKMTVGSKSFTATLADNTSGKALLEHLRKGEVKVLMNDYGDMEKVGSLGFSLPRNDVQTVTKPGDLILYQGNYLVIYYDRNSWNFTPLGKVDNISSRNDMLNLLGGEGDVTVTLSLE